MGSAASLEALPDTLSMDDVKALCGSSFNAQEFHFLAEGGEKISKGDFLNALHNKTDVFLTHDWGKELGQDNHARVAEINKRLQARGLTTWFDSEQMEGNVKKQMALGIDNAQCIVAFITKRYIDKVGGFNAEDNCQLEFNYAARRKTASRMIPVVMEERVRDTGTWDGEVGLVLGGRLYVDMCGNTWDNDYMDACITDLYSKIIKIIKMPIKGLSIGNTVVETHDKSFAETMPSQVRPSPTKSPKNSKPLRELTIEEVGKLLESNKLGKFVDEMKSNDVDGETLMEVGNDDELKELGISLAVKARMFYKKINEEYKYGGVPFNLIGIEEEKESIVTTTSSDVQSSAAKTAVVYGDGKFRISGATGGCAGRFNGIFEISDEMQNGLPVYSKEGDSDTFIELCKIAVGWRWYVKQAKDKGPGNSVCYGYCVCKDDDMQLPSHIDPSSWFVYADKVFGVQSTLKVTPCDSLPLPNNITQLLNQARISIREAKEKLLAEEKRDPLPGSFTISGAIGKFPHRINGVFEPTTESQNGFPVYRKKADGETWVEIVHNATSGWRWYLKPLANKGPDSSLCFAYFTCSEDNVQLPQDCKDWFVSTDDGFKQGSTSVSLSTSQPLPQSVTSRFQEGLRIVKQKKTDREDQELRGVIAGTFKITGATGKSEGRLNGCFEPSDEIQHGFPVYRKKGDTDTWIELVNSASGWRWYLKPTANKGPGSSICFAYYQCDAHNVQLPPDCTSAWSVHTASGFVAQAIKVTLESTLSLPSHLLTSITEGRAAIKKQYDDKAAEQTRNALPGSFRIEGTTGKCAELVNGTYEPTIESQFGFPVYRKKGEHDMWVEMVFKVASGWRWYVKPTANRGEESSLCHAYGQCVEDNVMLPGDLKDWTVSTNEGFVLQSTVTISRPGGGDTEEILRRLGEGKAKVAKMKADRYAEDARTAVLGSFRIEGAVGKSALRTNGIFEPTLAMQNGMPVYSKKGDADTWIELVHGASGWRWYLKPTANKGPDSSLCFTYYGHDGTNVKVPLECTKPWHVNTAEGFQPQSVKITAVGPAGQPSHVPAKWTPPS